MAIVAQGLEHWIVVPGVEGSNPFDRPSLHSPYGLHVSTVEAIFLGIIQGLTEFLPVSSSGHLTLVQHLFGFEHLDQMIPFDLICHLGTLLSILIVYHKQITSIMTENKQALVQIIIGTLPLFPVLFVLKKIESIYNRPELLGYFFLITAGLLWLGIRFGYEKPEKEKKKRRIVDPLIIGTFQTLALFPGVSRSGATISAARLLGWKMQESLSFSFLLAIPAILGGTLLKSIQLYSNHTLATFDLPVSSYLAGFFTAFLFGLLALKVLIRLAANQKMMYFVWYCLLLGLGCLLVLS